ncbi:MAG TPA: DUF4912 domain-containing protein [Bacillus sp. (in: firmicutes)]|nr:DUF4912 domain-containing protein [Bacillus sp. (in: firmicutes)]
MSIEHLDVDLCKILCWNDSSLSVHWNISTLSKQLFEECFLCEWKEEVLCLIVYDITNVIFNGHNANKWKVYPLQLEEKHTFLTLPVNKTYIVDIAVPLSTSYYTILRSNSIHLNGDSSAETDIQPRPFSDWQLNRPISPEWSPLFSTYSCYTKNVR